MRTVGENLIEEKNKQARLEDKMMNLRKKDKNYNKRSSEAVAALALIRGKIKILKKLFYTNGKIVIFVNVNKTQMQGYVYTNNIN